MKEQGVQNVEQLLARGAQLREQADKRAAARVASHLAEKPQVSLNHAPHNPGLKQTDTMAVHLGSGSKGKGKREDY